MPGSSVVSCCAVYFSLTTDLQGASFFQRIALVWLHVFETLRFPAGPSDDHRSRKPVCTQPKVQPQIVAGLVARPALDLLHLLAAVGLHDHACSNSTSICLLSLQAD